MVRNIDAQLVKQITILSNRMDVSSFVIAKFLFILFLTGCLLDSFLDFSLHKFTSHTFATLIFLPFSLTFFMPDLLKSEKRCKSDPQLINPLYRIMIGPRIGGIALL